MPIHACARGGAAVAEPLYRGSDMSTDEAKINLARRAVACPGWRWMPGMRYRGESWGAWGWVRVSERPEHIAALNERAGDDEVPVSELLHAIRVLLPDLDDPATLGCLLALVREAWGCNEWRRLTIEPAGEGWCVVLRNARHRPPSRARGGWDLDPIAHPRYKDIVGPFGANDFDSETEALVSALECAPWEMSTPRCEVSL